MENYFINKRQLFIEGKQVDIYPSPVPDSPVIYLNTFSRESDAIYKILREKGCEHFSLAAVSSLDWDKDMSPWAIPPISAGDTPCSGGANKYLKLLIDKILPKAEENIQGGISCRAIAGYSLAGLFAVYSMYCTDVFTRAASVSGSLWFPGFKEYVFSHEMAVWPDCLYFSLGNKERRTKNPYLKTVQDNTEAIFEFYKNKGVDTVFELNQGNHFKNAAERTASGIKWILEK